MSMNQTLQITPGNVRVTTKCYLHAECVRQKVK